MTLKGSDKVMSSFNQMEDMWFEGLAGENISLMPMVHILPPFDGAEVPMKAKSHEANGNQ
jgi:hypothetical protein